MTAGRNTPRLKQRTYAELGMSPVIADGWDSRTGKWSDESVGGRIVMALRAGNHIGPAADFAGVRARTVNNWLRRGRDDYVEENFDRMKLSEPKRIYVDFMLEVTKAESSLEVELVTYWRSHAREDWRAARDLLARRRPERWKEVRGEEVSGPNGGPIPVALINLPVITRAIGADPELRSLAVQMLERVTSETPPDGEATVEDPAEVALED